MNFRIPLVIVGLAAVLVSCQKNVETPVATETAVDNVSDSSNIITTFINQKAIATNFCSGIGGYLESLPKEYSTSTKKYPLLLFIHGIGEMGNGTTDLWKVTRNSVPHLLQTNSFPQTFSTSKGIYSFVIVSPQFKSWPSVETVNGMVNYAIKHYRIDTTRIYLTGLSMGGGVVMDYAQVYGKRLAAIVPMSEASYPTAAKAQAIAKTGLPIWAFHNLYDGRVSSSYTINFINYINSYNPLVKARKTIFNASGHNSWSQASAPTYSENNMNIYEWMLQYKRS